MKATCLSPSCGYVWQPRVPQPVSCPQCKGRKVLVR